MSDPQPTPSPDLSRDLNPLWHVRQLFGKHGAHKNRAARARERGVDLHSVNRVFRRDDATYQGVPKKNVLRDLARFVGCQYNELLFAFNSDLHPDAEACVVNVQSVVALMATMTEERQRGLIELARVLQFATDQRQAEILRYSKRVVLGDTHSGEPDDALVTD